MCAAPLLYIPRGLIVLLAECLACCLSTVYTETVLPKTAERLLEEQLFKLHQSTFLRKILTYMQTSCTGCRILLIRLEKEQNLNMSLFLWKWRTQQGAGATCRFQTTHTFYIYILLISAIHRFGLTSLHVWLLFLT